MKKFPHCERRLWGWAGFSVHLLLLLLISAPLHAGPHGGLPRRGYEPPPYNPEPDYWREFADLNSNTKKLLATIGATNADAAAGLWQIQTNADFLHDKWNVWFGTHGRSQTYYSPSDAYLFSLRADNSQLAKARKEKDAAKTLAIVSDVALDLQIKADNCRHSGDGLGKEIKVKVHTKADGKEAGGYEIFFVSKGMFDVKSAHDRFSRQSSPTDEKILPPGGYKFWARKEKFSTEPVAMGIGGHGETSVEVDLTVPSQ